MTSPVQDPIYSPFAPFVQGLGLTWLSNTTLSVAAGTATDARNANALPLASAVTINAATNGAAGLDVGSLAASTVYYVYLVAYSGSLTNPTAPYQPSAVLSASATSPYLPYGYDSYRRIGSVLTDGSSHILKFEQTIAAGSSNRRMWFDAPISVTLGTSTTYAAVSLAAYIPAETTDVTLNVSITPNAAADALYFRETGATGDQVIVTGVVAAVAQKLQVVVPVNATPSFDYKVTSSSDTVTANLAAYTDTL